jgi:hypothetical protein
MIEIVAGVTLFIDGKFAVKPSPQPHCRAIRCAPVMQ